MDFFAFARKKFEEVIFGIKVWCGNKGLKGVFAKHERGYRLTSKNILW